MSNKHLGKHAAVAVAVGLLGGLVLLKMLAKPEDSAGDRAASHRSTAHDRLVSQFVEAAANGEHARVDTLYKRLKRIGADALPSAVHLLESESEDERIFGAELVQGIVEELRERGARMDDVDILESIQPLTKALRDTSPHVRGKALSALGWIGTPAKRALPEIQVALEDADPGVRAKAERAAARVAGENL